MANSYSHLNNTKMRLRNLKLNLSTYFTYNQ